MRCTISILALCLLSDVALAQQTELNEAEQAFVDLLTNATMVGRFSIDGRDTPPKEERYEISKVQKLGGSKWLVTARIKYGQNDLEVPVAVDVDWAGDTPVLSVTDISIPGLGQGFTTRVLFYRDRYAGSWYHGQAGGHMWGKIEPAEKRKETSQSEMSPFDRKVFEQLEKNLNQIEFYENPLSDVVDLLAAKGGVFIKFGPQVDDSVKQASITFAPNVYRRYRLGHILPRLLNRVGLAPYVTDGTIEIRPTGSRGVLAESSEQEPDVREALDQKFRFVFVNAPLHIVRDYTRSFTMVDVEVAPGINTDLAFTLQTDGLRLVDGLEVMLTDVGLEAVPKWGCIFIRPKYGKLTKAHQQLGTATTAEFQQAPLADVAEYFGKLHDVTVSLGPGVDPDIPITYVREKILLHCASTELLNAHNLKPAVKDETIRIVKKSD